MPETRPAVPSFATKNAGGLARLRAVAEAMEEVPLMFKTFFWYGERERAVSNHYHRQFLRALEAGAGERAETIMREHVYEGRDFIISALEEEMR